jgi:MYXO-CTERM domain-containing protein
MSVSCVALTTECRVFTDPPANRCAGFGECASSTALSECTAFTDAPDGTACTSACGGMGMCMAGGCACMSVAPTPFVRTLPAAGCSVAPGSDTGAPLFVLLLALALAFRRRLRVVCFLLFAGCSGNQVALDVTLHLDDPVLVATDHARIVISGNTSFSTMAAATIKPGLTVTNEDADGDGKIDIVITLARDYAFARDNRFRLLNDPIATPIGLTLRAETFDNLGNRFARIGGMSADPAATAVQALLTPGQETQAAQLKPACLNQCSDSTLHLTASEATLAVTLADEPTALAVGGVMRNDALVGAAHADSTQGGLARPNGGLAWLYQGGATPSTMPTLTLAGTAGDELGAAAAIADLDGDGAAELILGAPGANSGAGAVYVVWGGATTPPTIDLASATLPAFVSVVTGTQANDRLGASLAVADVNGDGKPDLLAGADGAATAYAITSAVLTRGASTAAAPLPAATGPSGSRFGASLAAAAGRIVVGAPTQGSKGAAYTLVTSDFATPAKAAGSPTAGRGGGFGAAVTAIDVDGSGTALAVAAAPDDGPGTTSVLSSSPMIVQAVAPLSRMGASLARLAWPGGDAVVLGAPSSIPATSPGAGSVLIVRGVTLGVAPQLVVGADGRPAAVSITGAHAGDGIGAQVAVGDLDGDGYADVLITTTSKSLLVFRGPVL